jgi:hypothetical protein
VLTLRIIYRHAEDGRIQGVHVQHPRTDAEATRILRALFAWLNLCEFVDVRVELTDNNEEAS